MTHWDLALIAGLVGAGMFFGGAAVTAADRETASTVAIQKGIVGKRGALIISAGKCTVYIYSGDTRRSPPDTVTYGACEGIRDTILRALRRGED